MSRHVTLARTLVLVLLLPATHMSTCVTAERSYCKDVHTDNIKFSDEEGPATLAYGCVDQKTLLICCMSGFTSIEWFQFNESTQLWQNFGGHGRHFYESNQTTSIDQPKKTDSGQYKCVGHGITRDQTIVNQVKLVVYECAHFHQVPTVIKPSANVTTKLRELNEPLVVECEALFGTLDRTNCGTNLTHCDIGWNVRSVRKGSTSPDSPEIIHHDQTQRVYAVNTIEGGNTRLRSTLHITRITEQDYDNIYTCWSFNDPGFGQQKQVLIARPPIPTALTSYMLTWWAATCGSLVAVIIIVSIVAFSCGLNIELYVKERSRTISTDDVYDIALLASASDEFGSYVHRKLSDEFLSYRSFKVYRYHENANGGEDCNNSFINAVYQARCAVVVLSTDLLEDLNCVYCLKNIMTRTHVVFVVHDLDLKDDNNLRVVSDEVRTYLRYRRRHVVWPTVSSTTLTIRSSGTEAEPLFDKIERHNNHAVQRFWKRVRLLIPASHLCDGSQTDDVTQRSEPSQPRSYNAMISNDSGWSDTLSDTLTSSISEEEQALLSSNYSSNKNTHHRMPKVAA